MGTALQKTEYDCVIHILLYASSYIKKWFLKGNRMVLDQFTGSRCIATFPTCCMMMTSVHNKSSKALLYAVVVHLRRKASAICGLERQMDSHHDSSIGRAPLQASSATA